MEPHAAAQRLENVGRVSSELTGNLKIRERAVADIGVSEERSAVVDGRPTDAAHEGVVAGLRCCYRRALYPAFCGFHRRPDYIIILLLLQDVGGSCGARGGE